MSLADLKRKAAAKKRKKIDIDDFIEDAASYAKGKSILAPNLDVNTAADKKRQRNFKNATFTLSPAHIEQLNDLAEHSGFAKSRILRLLIEQLANGENSDLNQLLESLENKNQK
jgi:predicted DNA-binding protein